MGSGIRKATTEYSLVQAAFWMDVCIALSFASVYLLGIGYSNTGLGIIIAAGNLISALIGPALSSYIDRNDNVTAAGLSVPLMGARMVMVIMLILFRSPGALTGICFVLYIAFAMSINSLNLKMYIDASHNGTAIDYAFSRGMGSLAYVVLSFVLGAVIGQTSVYAVTAAALVNGLLQLAFFMLFRRKAGESLASKTIPGGHGGNNLTGTTIAGFAAENRRFCVMLAGCVLIFFSHNTVCNFMINVTDNVGGGPGFMGFLNGFMAATEIPVMLAYTRLFGRKDQSVILRMSFIFFTVKAACIAAATSRLLLTAAFLIQAPSFGLYTAAIVPYTEMTVREEDSAKAQSLAFTVTTLSAVLAGTVSGWLFDHLSVPATMWISAAVCAAGMLIGIAACRSEK